MPAQSPVLDGHCAPALPQTQSLGSPCAQLCDPLINLLWVHHSRPSLFLFSFLKREREREGDEHWYERKALPLTGALTGDQTHSLALCPDQQLHQ